MYCRNCGYENKNETNYCENCGNKLEKVLTTEPENKINNENESNQNNKKPKNIQHIILSVLVFIILTVLYYILIGIICVLINPLLGWAIAMGLGLIIAPIISLISLKKVTKKIEEIIKNNKPSSKIILIFVFWITLYIITLRIFLNLSRIFSNTLSLSEIYPIIKPSSVIIGLVLSIILVSYLYKNQN